MTLIVAYVDETGSYIGSDSMGSNGHSGGIYKNKKVFKVGDDMLVGGCGSYKELQLLEKDFTAPKRTIDQTDSGYMYNTFAHALKHFFDNHDVLSNKEGVMSNRAGEFLFIYRGVIYKWQSDLALLETVLPFDATGSGEEYAHAVMSTLESQKSALSPEQKIKEAVNLTSNYVVSVGGAVNIVKILDKKKKKD